MKSKNIAFVLISAFLLLTLCSMTSFLFPIHNRVDQNCFMTIGKGILNGQVPYRDLFDQKGPYVYFMHAAAAFISDSSFIGVFVFQFIFLVVLITYMRKIACMFVNKRHVNLIVFLTTALIMTTNCYLRGNNVEEYVMTLITVSIYYTLTEKRHNKGIIFLNGLFIGFVFWFKFNLLGFWIGWVLYILVPLLFKKRYKDILTTILLVLSGVVIFTIPVIIYFGVNGALYDLFYTYFYCNIFLYNNGSKIFFVFYLLLSSIKNFGLNPVYTTVIVIGFKKFLFTDRYIKDKVIRMNLFISFFILYLAVFFSGVWYDYYVLIIASYTVFGTIALYDWYYEVAKVKLSHYIPVLNNGKKLYRITVVYSLLLVVALSNCSPYINKDKTDFPQYRFAEIINKKKDATLLNFGFIDGGFYFASGIQPQNKYFHKINFPYEALPEMYDEQLDMIVNKEVDFVVARVKKKEKVTDVDCDELYENYEIVDSANDIHDRYKYILFERK